MEDDQDLLDRVYGVARDYPCVYGHFDCATVEGGACANETYARLLAAKDDNPVTGGPMLTSTELFPIGDQLPNGATVVAARPARTLGTVCVLAVWHGEYVTWLARENDPGSTVWGHYTSTLEAAVEDYLTRR